MRCRFAGIGAALLILTLSAAPRAASGAIPDHQPSLSVRESCYGTVTKGHKRESIQGLEIRVVSYEPPGFTCRIECFFLKRGRDGTPPSVDDTVIFDVTNPHGTYSVTARPIPLSRNAGKSGSGKKAASRNPNADFPREGWVVRVLHRRKVLEQRCSSHMVEDLVREDPALLPGAAAAKKARLLQAAELTDKS